MENFFAIFAQWFGCNHSRLSRVFTINRRTYRVCCDCGAEFDYSLENMSMKRFRTSGIVSGITGDELQQRRQAWVEAEISGP